MGDAAADFSAAFSQFSAVSAADFSRCRPLSAAAV
jgi:hypothetical protein